jgi:hypothetical protein
MKPKPVISNAAPESPRCRFRTQNGQCRMLAVDFSATLCVYHAQQALPQVPDTVDLLRPLTQPPSRFHSASEITHALSALFALLAQGRVSPRRATALAYIANLLLHNLPEVDTANASVREAESGGESLASSNKSAARSLDWTPANHGDSADSSVANNGESVHPSRIPGALRSNPSVLMSHSAPNLEPQPLPNTQPLPSTVEGFLAAVHSRRDTS